MKIATFNINGIVKRLDTLLAWLDTAQPDVVCLQELKASNADFPEASLADAGYGAVWHGQRSWNGVAILARDAEPVLTRRGLDGDDPREARYIEAAVSGVLVGCLYAPNGNPQPGPKYDNKIAWHARFAEHAAGLLAAGVPAVLAGDYNIVPEDCDIYATRSYADNALLQPEMRDQFRSLIATGWRDGLREVFPEEPALYTFWDYKRERWPRNAGLRLDHLLISPTLAPSLKAAGVDRQIRGGDNASDHAPAWIDIAS